jgi:hypothetical protein
MSMTRGILGVLCAGVLGALGVSGCSEVPATNPYDPSSPVELQRKATIEGIVSGETLGALVGAEITLSGPTSPDNNPLTTGDDGAFRFVELAPGRYVIRVEHPGHVSREIDLGSVVAGEVVERPIELEPRRASGQAPGQARLSGVAYKQGALALADEAARDHSGITVELEGTGLRTVTSRAGAFDFFLGAGTYTLVFSAPEHVRRTSDPIEVGVGETVTLETPFELASDPGAIVGSVLLEGAAEGGHGEVLVTLANTALTAVTDGDGAFRIDDVPAGVYSLRATRDGYAPAVVRGVIVPSHPDVVLEPIDLARARGDLEGSFGLAASEIADGIVVELVGAGLRALTGPSGGYRLEGVPVGDYDLRACRQGYEPATVAVTVAPDATTTAPPADAPVSLARQQIRLAPGGLTTEPAFTLRFEQVPAWAAEIRVVGDLAAGAPEGFVPFDAEQGAVALTLTDGAGPKRLEVQVRGDGCRVSDVLQTTITLDDAGPVLAGLTIREPTPTADPTLTAVLQQVGAHEIRLSGDLASVAGEAANVGVWLPAQAEIGLVLEAAEDGEKAITLEARDGAGNASVPASVRATVVLDRAPPSDVSLVVEEALGPAGEPGAPVLAPDVTLRLAAVGAAEMQISNDPTFADAQWQFFAPRVAGWFVAEPGADGEKTIYARFRDAAGNVAEASITIVLDRLGVVTGRVALEGTDACIPATLLVDGVLDATARWDGCAFEADVSIGAPTVEVARDGFETGAARTLEVGPAVPVDLGTVELLRARGSASGEIRLQGRADGNQGGTLVTFQNVSAPVAGESLPDYAATTLADGTFSVRDIWAGRYQVTAQREGFSVRDLGQILIEAARDTAVTAPGSPVVLTQQVGDFLIDGGAGFTRDPLVDLELEFDNVVRFRLRVGGGEFGDWIDYAPDPDGTMRYAAVDLGVGDGTRQIEIETEDDNGVRSGEPYFEASIVLDTRPPTDPDVVVDGGAAYTNQRLGRVVLTLSADDENGIDRVRLSPADDCEADGPAVPFAPVVNYELDRPDVDGTKPIYACFIDPAGNVSGSAAASIILDTTPPEIVAVEVFDHAGDPCGQACLVNDASILLSVTEAEQDDLGSGDAAEIRLGLDPTFPTGAWQARQPGPVPFLLPLSDGAHTVHLKLRDAAGNESDVAQLALTLDREPPAAPDAAGPEWVGAPTLPVTLSNSAAAAAVEYDWRSDFADATSVAPADALDVALPADAAPGAHTLYLRYVDAASNRSAIAEVRTTYDITPPVIASATLGGAADGEVTAVASPVGVPLQVLCVDDLASAGALTLTLTDEGAAPESIAAAPLVAVDLQGGGGPGTLAVRCVDPAGNASEASALAYNIDATAPPAGTNSLTINGGDSHTPARSVILDLSLADDAGGTGIAGFALANTAIDCDTANYGGRADIDELGRAQADWVLADGDGEKTVVACVRDAAGNTTQISDAIVLDATAPEGDFSFAEGAHSPRTTVTVRVTRDDGDAVRMRIFPDAVPDCAGELPGVLADPSAVFDAGDQAVELGGEGTFQVSVCLFDAAGNSTRITRSITVDTSDPFGELELAGGAAYTSERSVAVSLSPSADVVDVKVVNVGGPDAVPGCADDAGYVALDLSLDHDLVAGDGMKYVRACFRDAAGNTAVVPEPGAAAIRLDTVAPPVAANALAIRTAAGEAREAVNERSVTLELTLADDATGSGVGAIALASTAIDCDTADYREPTDALSWTLTAGDGGKTVAACVRDRAGNVTPLSDTVTLDTVPPAGGLAVVGGTDVADPVLRVLVTRSSADAAKMVLSEGIPDCAASLPDVLDDAEADFDAAEQRLDLGGDGAFTVSVCLFDEAGNSTRISRSVNVDTVDPAGDLEINRGATYTTSRDVTVYLSPSADVVEMKVEDVADADAAPDCAAPAGWLPLDLAYDHQLEDGEGAKYVRACVRDRAGNTALAPTDAAYAITLDRIPPPAAQSSLEITTSDGVARDAVRERAVRLALAATDNPGGSGVDALAIQNTAIDCDAAEFRTPTADLAWTLEAGEGAKTVAACVRDAAGNVTQITDTVVLDTTPPGGDLTFPGGVFSPSTTVAVQPARDDLDATKMVIAAGVADCGAYLPDVLDDAGADFDGAARPIDLGEEGTFAVSLCLYDRAGNSTRITRSVTVDQTPPTGNMDIARDATYTTSRTVTLNLSTSPDVAAISILNVAAEGAAVDCDAAGGYAPVDLAPSHELIAGDGAKYVRVCLRDSAGNTAAIPAAGADSIVLDGTAPAPVRVIAEGGAALTSNATLGLSLGARDATSGVRGYKVSENAACTGGAWAEWEDGDNDGSIDLQFAVADGDNVERTVSVRFRDAAGNLSECATDAIDVDSVPLSLTAFSLSGGAGDAPGYTSSRDVFISDIGYDGVGDCARYEVSFSPAFLPAATTAYAGCPLPPLALTLPDVADGPQTLHARVVDTAGNISDPLVAQIELDSANPVLTGVTLDYGPDARPSGTKYTNLQDVSVRLTAPYGGGARIRYARLENGANPCPAVDAMTEEASVTPGFTVRFALEGPKKICVALEDEVGNTSEVRSDTIIIDTTAPPSPSLPQGSLPGVNASCAYVEARRVSVAEADFWRFELRDSSGAWVPLGEDNQDPNDVFDSAAPADVAHARFDLTQDADNLLQVRVVDPAGNASEPGQILVEEVSSFLVPTDLQMKQICNAGQYAILREETGTVTNYRRPACFDDEVVVEDAPEHALLDLDRLSVREISPSLDLGDLTDEACKTVALDASVLDATCSPEAGFPQLLIARPDTDTGVVGCALFNTQPCMDIAAEYPEAAIKGEVDLVVMPDPIDDPFAPLGQLAPVLAADGDPRGVHTLGVLDWTGDPAAGDYAFRALSTGIERTHTRRCFLIDGDFVCSIGTSWETEIRRIRSYNGACEADDGIPGVDCQILADPAYAGVGGAGNFAIHGLTIYNSGTHYTYFDPTDDAWEVWYTTSTGSAGAIVGTFADVFTDIAAPPFRNRVSPAHWYHVNSGAPQEARGNYVYLHDNGSVRARRPLSSAEQVLATGGVIGEDRVAAFFEVGEDEAWWVDADDPRVLYQSSTYGENGVRLRYAVDRTKPILPPLGSAVGLGDPFVYYHTSGVTRGVVVVYRDDNDEAADECTR